MVAGNVINCCDKFTLKPIAIQYNTSFLIFSVNKVAKLFLIVVVFQVKEIYNNVFFSF